MNCMEIVWHNLVNPIIHTRLRGTVYTTRFRIQEPSEGVFGLGFGGFSTFSGSIVFGSDKKETSFNVAKLKINYNMRRQMTWPSLFNHGINLYGLTIVLTHSPISQPQRHVALDQATVVRSTLPWRHGFCRRRDGNPPAGKRKDWSWRIVWIDHQQTMIDKVTVIILIIIKIII